MKLVLFCLLYLVLGTLSYAKVKIDSPYIRAIPATSKMTAAYMKVTNLETKEVELVAASSPMAGKVEIHTHTKENGMMKMRKLSKLTLPAQQEVVFKPHGLHLMFFRVKAPLEKGSKVDVELKFSDGATQKIFFDVK